MEILTFISSVTAVTTILVLILGTMIINISISDGGVCETKITRSRAITVGAGYLLYSILCACIGYSSIKLVVFLINSAKKDYGVEGSYLVHITITISFICVFLLFLLRGTPVEKLFRMIFLRNRIIASMVLIIIASGLLSIVPAAIYYPHIMFAGEEKQILFFMLVGLYLYSNTILFSHYLYSNWIIRGESRGIAPLITQVVQQVNIIGDYEKRDYWKLLGYNIQRKGKYIKIKDVYLVEDIDTEYVVQQRNKLKNGKKSNKYLRIKKEYILGIEPVLQTK